MMSFAKNLETLGFSVMTGEVSVFDTGCFIAQIHDEYSNTLGVYWAEVDGVVTARVDKINGTHKWYYEKSGAQMMRVIRQCMEGHKFVA